jgi:glycosyltransferase involved in cell wall biosynthesis
LVEMMHFGVPVLAYNCVFNRFTTEGKALFFEDSSRLRSALDSLTLDAAAQIGAHMLSIAQRRYTWASVSQSYFRVLDGEPISDVGVRDVQVPLHEPRRS